jgi:serine/threonine protein kinase
MGSRYQIIESIGKGGVSEIYRAYDTELEREVAIKRLLPLERSRLNEPQSYGLDREVQALTRLRHPNVVSLYEFGEDRRGPFVVLELIEGTTLQEVIVEGALSYPDFLEVARQVLRAMIAAHDMDLLHRDLKPANIMLSQTPEEDLQVKILDFGVSKFQKHPSTQTVDISGAVIGSADYIAPEQVEQKPIDHRADLYSIGCVLYYSLAQKRPFRGGNVSQTVLNHVSNNVIPIRSFRPDIPGIIGAWLMKLLERSPDSRPQNARVALAMLEKACRLASAPDAEFTGWDERDADLPVAERGSHHAPPHIAKSKEKDHTAPQPGPDHFTRTV